MPSLADVIAVLDGWFPPATAESWDAVGLVCGDPVDEVRRILLAVDAVPATVAEAATSGADLLLTHHPLLLSGVHGVPADDPKGALVHRMIRAGTAHFVAHTNADVARPGVSDALADLFGVQRTQPLDPLPTDPLDKLVVFVPAAATDALVDALGAAGAGRIGDYDRCAWASRGEGTFRPLAGATPTIGEVGAIEKVVETRVEMVVPRARRRAVVDALRAAHPYEEPAFDLLPMAPIPAASGAGPGTGRIGELAEATTLRDFTARAAALLPSTVWGVRAAGDPDRVVRRVAVCGGSGGGYADAARAAGADVLLTSDLKHHAGVEIVTERGGATMGLVDAAHWATESPWLDRLAARLRDTLTTVDAQVSRIVTDPWTMHHGQRGNQ